MIALDSPTALAEEVRRLGRCVTVQTENWFHAAARVELLERALQVCPMGCGWTGDRTPDRERPGRFLDVCGLDLAGHLASAHGATDRLAA